MLKQAFIGGLGTTELIIILVIVLIFFGAGKLPSIGGALGKTLKNLKKELNPSGDEAGANDKGTASDEPKHP